MSKRRSKELSSPSPEEPPIWKVARFRFGGVLGLAEGNCLRIDDDAEVGASCERDLVEHEM